MDCGNCGTALTGHRRKFCSDDCRNSARDRWDYKLQLTCAVCGDPMYIGKGSLPQGQAMHRKCRGRLAPRQYGDYRDYQTPCIDCGAPSTGRRCLPCYRAEHSVDVADRNDARRRLALRRAERDHSAPGLGPWQRKQLRAKWLKQGRSCTYCPAPFEQVDHVIPLALGGTNYEGNLTPACRACNLAKSDNLVMEWRTGKKARHIRWDVEIGPRRERKTRKPKPPKTIRLRPCGLCSSQMVEAPSLYCSDECRVEKNRRVQRDRYRKRVGLPVNPTRPTSKWRPVADPMLPIGLSQVA